MLFINACICCSSSFRFHSTEFSADICSGNSDHLPITSLLSFKKYFFFCLMNEAFSFDTFSKVWICISLCRFPCKVAFAVVNGTWFQTFRRLSIVPSINYCKVHVMLAMQIYTNLFLPASKKMPTVYRRPGMAFLGHVFLNCFLFVQRNVKCVLSNTNCKCGSAFVHVQRIYISSYMFSCSWIINLYASVFLRQLKSSLFRLVGQGKPLCVSL